MQIDCYGFEASSQWFRRKSLDVYLMKEQEGVYYLCFGPQTLRPIHRIDKDADADIKLSSTITSFARCGRHGGRHSHAGAILFVFSA